MCCGVLQNGCMEKQKRYQQLNKLWGDLKNSRTNYEAGWKDITRFCAPQRDFWTTIKENAYAPAAQVYDGTPISALNLLANGLQGYMASKTTKSFKVGLESFRTLRHQPYEGRMRRYMQDVEEVFYRMINQSNFYTAANEAFHVGGSIGTTVMFVDLVPGEQRLVNMVCKPNDVWIAENDVGIVDTIYRRMNMTAKDIVRRWEKGLTEEFIKQAAAAPYGLHEIVHCVLPRDTRDASKIDNLNKAFASYWLLTENTTILQESGFDENPYIVWRWSTPNGGTYGWSPAHSAMADILRSNQANKTLLEAAHLAVYPALNVPQEQMGKLDLRPRGMNPYIDPSRMVKPIQQLGSYPIAKDREDAINMTIREHFFVDMFLMLNQAAQMTGKFTATQVLEMQSEKAAIMGAITTRIESEFFDPLFDRYFEIAGQQGWLPQPPPELLEILEGSDVKIDYIGPMAQVQQRFYQMQSLEQPIEKLIKYGQFFPEVMDLVDPDKFGRHLINESSLPQDLIRDQKTVLGIRQQRASQKQAAMEAENAQKNAKAAKDMSNADPQTLKQLMSEATGGMV